MVTLDILAFTGYLTLILYRKAAFLGAMYRKKRTNDIRNSSAQISAQGSEIAATLPQRLEESASGLLKDSFGLPPSRAVTGALASLNPENTKGGVSSSSTGTVESSLGFISSAPCEQANLDNSESFRSNEKLGNIGRIYGQIAFDEFLAGSNELVHEPKLLQDRPALKDEHCEDFFAGIAENGLPQVRKRGPWKVQGENQDFPAENNDGAAVVSLLSDPAFVVDEEPGNTLNLKSDGVEGQSYERLHIGKVPVKSLNSSLPSNRSDLIPDFGTPLNLSHAIPPTQKGIHGKEHFQDSRFWQVQSWIDILDRYHDEVWGDMLPLVQEARNELKVINEKQTYLEDGPAIRRLKMVLRHLGN